MFCSKVKLDSTGLVQASGEHWRHHRNH